MFCSHSRVSEPQFLHEDINVCLSHQAGCWGEASAFLAGTDVFHTVHQNGRSVRGRAAWRSKGAKKAWRDIPPKQAIYGVRSNRNPHSSLPWAQKYSAPGSAKDRRSIFRDEPVLSFIHLYTYSLHQHVLRRGICGDPRGGTDEDPAFKDFMAYLAR